jgi:hypothetical protein
MKNKLAPSRFLPLLKITGQKQVIALRIALQSMGSRLQMANLLRRLTTEHSEACLQLKVGLTNYKPQITELSQAKQGQGSH